MGAKRLDDIIAEHGDKTLTLTVKELHSIHRDAFYAGHETSQYSPNISGEEKRAFVNSPIFEYTESFK